MNNLLFLKGIAKKDFFWSYLLTGIWSAFWISDAVYCVLLRNPVRIQQNPVALTHPYLHPLFIMDLGTVIACVLFIGIPVLFGYRTAVVAKKKNMNVNFAYFIGFIIPVVGYIAYRLVKPGVEGSPPGKPEQLMYGGFWIRLCALIVDYLILFIPCCGWYILSQLVFHKPFTAFGLPELAAYYMTLGVMGWLYDSLFWSSEFGSTPGKMLFAMRVTDPAGQRINFTKASIRWLGKIVSDLTLGIGYLIIGFTYKKQGLHDFIAGTVVIQRE